MRSLRLGVLISLAALAPRAQEPARKLAPPDARAATFDEAELNERVTPEVKAVRRAENSVVSIYVLQRERAMRGTDLQGQGSGVIIDASGMVITNWHVVAFAATNPSHFQLHVRLRNKSAYTARILNASRDNDLALLQLELPAGEDVRPVAIGDSDSLMVGETVIAIGNPQGHANTVTRGVLSATEREIAARTPDGGVLQLKNLLQTDAAINQGNSGGALLDITGKLIGVNNAMAANAENIGFAIPVNTVQRVFQELLVGSASFALWLGMKVSEQNEGLVVAAVDAGSPAAAAGLRIGDRLVAAGSKPVANAVEYARALMAAQPGREFPLAIVRGARQLELSPVPLAPAMGVIARAVGITVEEVIDQQTLRAASAAYSSDQRRRTQLRVVLRVASVEPEGTGAVLGLRAGDLLLYWIESTMWGRAQQQFHNVENFASLLSAVRGSELSVAILRGDEVLVGPLGVR